jgi:hypothetical protein
MCTSASTEFKDIFFTVVQIVSSESDMMTSGGER